MFRGKNLILAASVFSATTLSFTAISINDKKENTKVSVNTVVLSDQVQEKQQAVYTVYAANINTEQFESDIKNYLLTYAARNKYTPLKENEIKINTYTVKAGDTIESIAGSYNLKSSTITESNGLSANASLKEGQVLEFPSIDGVLYKISEGETLWDLSLLNKFDMNKVVELNKLESADKLKIGQKIIVPDVDKLLSVSAASSTKKAAKSSSKVVASSRGSSSIKLIGALPVSGTISSRFGKRWGKQHTGVDIAAPTGTDVFAFADGKVVTSGWDGGYGKLIVIDHGNGIRTYYGHNSKLLVKVGQLVKKGTHIADVGSTGNSTGPHCHFEIRKNGVAVNPLNYAK